MNFKIGDLCEVIAAHETRHAVGLECTVLALNVPYKHFGLCYYVELSDGRCMYANDRHIRLKRPPNKDEFTAGEWSLCPFNPYKAKERVT